MTSAFEFRTELRLVALTGVRARSLAELRIALTTVPGSSVFYHTHHQYLAHHFQKPVYYNDFALWAADAHRDDILAEQLAALDLLEFTTVRELREAIIAALDSHLASMASPRRECAPEQTFHFCRSRSFIVRTDLLAHDVPEFFAQLARISNASLYFHYFEARLRLGRRTNDFSAWLASMGRADLAAAIDALNPYTRTLDELKQDIIEIGQRAASATGLMQEDREHAR
jgi:hypothetical protein